MALNSLFADRKSCSNFLVAESLSDQSENFDFASGERGLRQAVGELAGNFRRDRASPRVHIADRFDKLLVGRLLRQKCYCSGLQRLVDILVRCKRRKDDDLRGGRLPPDLTDGLDSATAAFQ